MTFPFGRGRRGRGRGRESSSPSTPPTDHVTSSPQYYIGSSSQPLPFQSAPQSSPDIPIDNPSSSSERVPVTQEQERTLLLPDGKG